MTEHKYPLAEKMAEVLEAVEWNGAITVDICPACVRFKSTDDGHADNCKLAEALREWEQSK